MSVCVREKQSVCECACESEFVRVYVCLKERICVLVCVC